MDKKKLKADRVKSFFIEAAKYIVLKEGPENVSVRKIADLSGYSYGSIYNYYKDLNELMAEVKMEMLKDLASVMGNYLNDRKYTIEDIKEMNIMLADYFIDNQNIYKLFYVYEIKIDHPTHPQNFDMSQVYWNTYKGFVEDGIIRAEDVPVLSKTIIYSLYGLLSMYYASNGLTREQIHKDLSDIIQHLLT